MTRPGSLLAMALCLAGTGYADETQLKAANLVGRWSFNGSLKNAVGGRTATCVGGARLVGNRVELPGGPHGAGYVNLGADVLPKQGPLTIEIWATPRSVRNWSRIFDVGSVLEDSLLMSWSCGMDGGSDCVCIKKTLDAKLWGGYLAPYPLNRPVHVSMTLTPRADGCWDVACYKKDPAGGQTLRALRFTTSPGWSPAVQNQANFCLGHSYAPVDHDADAVYDEVRVWRCALTERELGASARRGADAVITDGKIPHELLVFPEVVTVPWTSPDVRAKGTWRADFDSGAPRLANGSFAWCATEIGAEATLTFTGTQAGVLYRPGARYGEWGLLHRDAERAAGEIAVFVDGKPADTIDTRAGDRAEVARNLPKGRHTLRIVNRGRDGKPARVAIRGFFCDGVCASPIDYSKDDPALVAEVAKLPPIIFFTGAPLESGAIPNAVWQAWPLGGAWGCSIRVRNTDGTVRTLFSEADSLIFDLALAYDAKKLLFTMRRHHAPAWQIYEMNVDGTGLRQLTNTPDAHNASPAYLPNGRIAFVSSREPRRHTVCQSGPSTLVHVMDADGSHVRRLSSNTLSDFNLGVLSDGRLLYSRWSYVDWNLTYRQSLWTQYPDGRQMALWFGNQSVDPASFVQAMELPDYSGAVCTFAPHHGSVYGAIGVVRTQKGPEGDGPDAVRIWTPEFPCVYDRNYFWAWCWPAPLAADRALASRGDGATKRFSIMLLADDGRRATVYADAATSCFRALPLVARRPPKDIAPFVDPLPKTYTVKAAPPGQPEDETVGVGRLVISDVYKGLDGKVPRGTVTHVRVMEQMPKTVNRSWNGVLDQGPLLSASTYYAKRVWTYAPVAADGSAHFEAPALKEIYLQLVDAEGREIRRMTDAINLMPGETQSCTGCHEGRRTAAVPLATSAARRAPAPITPPEWGNAGVLDYVKVVQPVWDRHCVKCHAGPTPPKGVNLSGGYTRFFNMSYDALVLRAKSDERSRAFFTGQTKEKPLVQGLHLLWGIAEPYEVKESGSFASRLPDYLKKEHCGAEIPLADRRRVYEWIDAQLPYYATSDHAHVGGKSGRDKWGEAEGDKLKPWFTRRFLPLYTNTCARCHGGINLKPNLSNNIEPQWWWFDLSKPEGSPILHAHLPQKAGGRGLGGFAFAGADDPVRKELLSIAQEAATEAAKTPEADMPGFVPRSRGRCEYRVGR